MSELPKERDFSKYTFNSDEYHELSSPVRRDAESGRLVPADAELIERAAKAIWEANPARRTDGSPVPWEDGTPPYLEDAYREAKAALQAVGVINGGKDV